MLVLLQVHLAFSAKQNHLGNLTTLPDTTHGAQGAPKAPTMTTTASGNAKATQFVVNFPAQQTQSLLADPRDELLKAQS